MLTMSVIIAGDTIELSQGALIARLEVDSRIDSSNIVRSERDGPDATVCKTAAATF